MTARRLEAYDSSNESKTSLLSQSTLSVCVFLVACSLALAQGAKPALPTLSQTSNYEFNDSHFHLTNYIQEGPDIRDFLNMMGTTTGRAVLSGDALQQQWSYRTDADRAPTYYLHSDAPLYYYSFIDAW